MNRFLALAITVLLTFGFASGNVAFLSGQTPKSASASGNAEQNHVGTTAELFKLSMMGEARASDNTPLGVRTYTGSKGTTVSIMYGTFASAEKSKAELQRWAESAKKVVQREPDKNASGQAVGERVLVIFTDSRTHVEYPVVVWTNGSDFFRVKSSSLQAVLQFEERIKGGVSLDDLYPTK